MINKNKNFFTILAFTKPKLINSVYNTIASSYYLVNPSLFELDSDNMAQKINSVYNNKLKIIIIDVEITEIKSYKIGNSINNDYTIITIPSTEFYSEEGIEKLLLNNNSINHCIFMIKNLDYKDIVVNLALLNIIVSGGSNNKKHILSPIQLRLSRFIIAISSFSGSDVADSFHFERETGKARIDWTSKESQNIITKLTKDKRNEFIHEREKIEKIENSKNKSEDQKNDINVSSHNVNSTLITPNQKREFHSFSTLKQEKNNLTSVSIGSPSVPLTSNNIEKNNNSNNTIFYYLNSVRNIINNSELTPEKAQSLIENNWISLIEEKLNDENFLVQRYSHRFTNVIFEAHKTLIILKERKVLYKKFPLFSQELEKIDFILLTFSLCISYSNRLSYTSIASNIGENIIFYLFKKSGYNSYLEFKNNIDYSQNLSVKLGDFFISLLSQHPHDLFERNFNVSSFYSKETATLKINSDYIEDIKNNIIVHPNTLPMICKPNIWSENLFGGFLDNSSKEVSVISGTNHHNHIIENKSALYKAINRLNSIKFGVNNLLLDYLNNEGNYFVRSIKQDNILQRTITLRIAETYSKLPFYLNVHADWRGRIYTQSFFLTYQGGDLSSALLELWEGQSLTESGKYQFYIHGANNHNENNISKESFDDRVNWVKDNYNKIINLDSSLILSADKPFIFLGFCLNMRELHNNPIAIIKTPVFLDATCSGIQHLSALLQDLELGISVNLTPYHQKDKPNDIYSDLIEPINKAINKFGEENLKYRNLSLVKLNRKIIKTSIMTKVYNVSQYGIAKQLESNLENNENLIINKISSDLSSSLKLNKINHFIAPGKDNINVRLNTIDIFKIAKIINDQIFVVFPSLNGIYSYFIEMSKIMVKLGVPISWITPSGIKITQHYLKTKQTIISSRLFNKNKKMVLREYLNEMDKQKQTNAIIPNIIHSLDASHLINLINNSGDQGLSPIITVHDCFGTHPNKMEELSFMVKKEFILIYSQDNFLEKFHNRLIQSIKDNNFEIIFNEQDQRNYVPLNENLIKIPNVPKLGKLDLQKIIDSKYMIT